MRKIWVFLFVSAVALVCFGYSIAFLNDRAAEDLAARLASIPLPEKTEIVEVYAHAGKPVGNGNGIQLVGAMMLKSELSTEELKKHYREYEQSFPQSALGRIAVDKQRGRELAFSVNEKLSFRTEGKENENYIIYSIETPENITGLLDLRGH